MYFSVFTCVMSVGGLPSQGFPSKLPLSRLNSAVNFLTMLYEGKLSPRVTTIFSWISFGGKLLIKK